MQRPRNTHVRAHTHTPTNTHTTTDTVLNRADAVRRNKTKRI